MTGRIMIMSGWALACAGVAASQTIVEGSVESVAMFKNGLAVITRIVEVPGSGEYLLERVPTAVHGTFWLESDALVSAHVEVRQIEVPLDQSAGSNLRDELVDRQVTVLLREPVDVRIDGRVVRLEEVGAAYEWSRTYEASPYRWYNWSAAGRATRPEIRSGAAMLLDDGSKRHYIDQANIALLTVHDPQATMIRRQPAMRLNVERPPDSQEGPFTITLTYLAKGLTWAPAYFADLDDGSKLRINQQATIRNELEDIEDAEFLLISGFPSIEFSHVDSLAGATATIAGFFSQLNQRVGGRHAARRDVMSQSAVMTNIGPPETELDLDELVEAGSVDIHYQSIGRHSLALGASMVLTVASAASTFDRAVELIIPDTRDAYGRPRAHNNNPYAFSTESEPEMGVPWDVIRFQNPFDFPMTTAPAMIRDRSRFTGQRMSYWTNPGDRSTVQVTRALSIRSAHSESELEATRVISSRFGQRGNTVDVQGEIVLWNHRNARTEVIVRRRFSGDLLDASHDPRTRLMEEGIFSFNKRNELIWNVVLEPGETTTLSYIYSVFIAR